MSGLLLAGCGDNRVAIYGDTRAKGAMLYVDGESLGTLTREHNIHRSPDDRDNLVASYRVDSHVLMLPRGEHLLVAKAADGATLSLQVEVGETTLIYFDFTADSAWASVVLY